MSTRTFSLWLCSSNPDVKTQLKKVIDTFADRLGTPKWNPHITLLGGIKNINPDEVLSLTRQVAKSSKSFRINLIDIAIKNLYFQCIMAIPFHTSELLALNSTAREIFSKQDTAPFWPHLSLVYGDLPEDQKKKIAEDIKREWNVVGSVVDVESIQIWDTSREVEEWQMVGEVRLGE